MSTSYLTSQKDYLNARNTRNRDNTPIKSYNCAGWALKTFSYYFPYDNNREIDQFLLPRYYRGDSFKELANELVQKMTSRLLIDFPQKIRVITDLNNLSPTESLISLRAGVHLDYNDYLDFDFHFRRRDGNRWSEKCGSGIVKECTEPNNWHLPSFIYNSETIYFAIQNN